MPVAEDVQRQIAVAVVVAVEVSALLLAVEGIIGGIEVDDDERARRAMRVEEDVDEQPLEGICIVVELVVAMYREPVQNDDAPMTRLWASVNARDAPYPGQSVPSLATARAWPTV